MDALWKNYSLWHYQETYSFPIPLFCNHLVYDVLLKINCISKKLQKKEVNLQSVLKLIDIVKAFLGSMRTDNGLSSVITDAKELADNLEISPELFNEEVLVSPRKIKNSFPTRGKTSP